MEMIFFFSDGVAFQRNFKDISQFHDAKDRGDNTSTASEFIYRIGFHLKFNITVLLATALSSLDPRGDAVGGLHTFRWPVENPRDELPRCTPSGVYNLRELCNYYR